MRRTCGSFPKEKGRKKKRYLFGNSFVCVTHDGYDVMLGLPHLSTVAHTEDLKKGLAEGKPSLSQDHLSKDAFLKCNDV